MRVVILKNVLQGTVADEKERRLRYRMIYNVGFRRIDLIIVAAWNFSRSS